MRVRAKKKLLPVSYLRSTKRIRNIEEIILDELVDFQLGPSQRPVFPPLFSIRPEAVFEYWPHHFPSAPSIYGVTHRFRPLAGIAGEITLAIPMSRNFQAPRRFSNVVVGSSNGVDDCFSDSRRTQIVNREKWKERTTVYTYTYTLYGKLARASMMHARAATARGEKRSIHSA